MSSAYITDVICVILSDTMSFCIYVIAYHAQLHVKFIYDNYNFNPVSADATYIKGHEIVFACSSNSTSQAESQAE